LNCEQNQITSLDVSNNTDLIFLDCSSGNNISSLDVSNNIALITLYCGYNQLTSLDVSQNTSLTSLWCEDNQLIRLDVRNGNNTNFTDFISTNNPNLFCVNVDDSIYSTNNWTSIDTWHYFSNNCNPLAIQEHSSKKELLKITDILGRKTKGTKNELLFYIYNDGTVEKRIVIE